MEDVIKLGPYISPSTVRILRKLRLAVHVDWIW